MKEKQNFWEVLTANKDCECIITLSALALVVFIPVSLGWAADTDTTTSASSPLTACRHIWTLVGIMMLSGVVGGYTNFLSEQKSNPEQASKRKSISSGVCAAFLVPLFLNMISSDLIKPPGGNTPFVYMYNYLVFTGFCLVAAISSRAFIQTLTDRILNEVKETKQRVETTQNEIEKVKSTVEPLAEKETETEVGEGLTHVKNLVGMDPNKKKILESLTKKYTFRSLSGIASDTQMNTEEINTCLNNLIKEGMIGQAYRKKGIRWYITESGRRAIG